MAVLGLALDRIWMGPRRTREPPAALADGPTEVTRAPAAVILPAAAREAVAAAWRSAGLEATDERVDRMAGRARASAILPETRLRVLRLVDERDHPDGSADTARAYGYTGSNLWLEARLTWRLDRLLYAEDEPTLERVRLERLDARARIAHQVLDALLDWARATLAGATALPGSREELEASLQRGAHEATLDVLTAGWFSQAVALGRFRPEAR
jgi:hypothetical protein